MQQENNYSKQLNDLNNLQPGESCVYFIGGNISRASQAHEARNTAYRGYMNDTLILTQRLLRRVSVPTRYFTEVSYFEYIATRKKAMPDPKEISVRSEYLDKISRG